MVPWILFLQVPLCFLALVLVVVIDTSWAQQDQQQHTSITKTRITTLIIPQNDLDGSRLTEGALVIDGPEAQWSPSVGNTLETCDAVPVQREDLITTTTTTTTTTTESKSIHPIPLPRALNSNPVNAPPIPSRPFPISRRPRTTSSSSRLPSLQDACWAAQECKKVFFTFSKCYTMSGKIKGPEDLWDERMGKGYQECLCGGVDGKGAFIENDNLNQCISCFSQAGASQDPFSTLINSINGLCSTKTPSVYLFLHSVLDFLTDADAPTTFTEIPEAISRITEFDGGQQSGGSTATQSSGMQGIGQMPSFELPRFWPYSAPAPARRKGETATFPLVNPDANTMSLTMSQTLGFLVHSLLWYPRALPSYSGIGHPLENWTPEVVSGSDVSGTKDVPMPETTETDGGIGSTLITQGPVEGGVSSESGRTSESQSVSTSQLGRGRDGDG